MKLLEWLGLTQPEPQAPAPEAWQAVINAMPLLAGYRAEELERLRQLLGEFVANKDFIGADGMIIDDTMRLLIAAQACIPILNLGMRWYRGWRSVIVYPASFRVPYTEADAAGVVHEGEHIRSGESWPSGPVVLSWPDVRAGALGDYDRNVVIHEFAHKLDQRSGDANGMPPLPRGMDRRLWSQALGAAFAQLNAQLDRGEDALLGDYEASSPAEFFAAVCELFFIHPERIDDAWPAVYAQLRIFFRQDPLGHRAAT